MAGLHHPAGIMSTFFVLLGLLALTPSIIEPVSGAIECEELPVEDCAFAVSSTGARCVLETDAQNNAAPEYKCQTSIIMAERPMEWIETEECISTCGLQRLSVGLSTDALLERDFTRKLCFSECRSKCPNINDLYTKLAAEEGIYLPTLCESLRPRRARKLVRQARQQREEPAFSTEKASVNTEAKTGQLQAEIAAVAVVAAAAQVPATSPSSSSGGGPIAAPPPANANAGEEPYPAAEPPSYEDAEAPFYEELPPSPAYEEEPLSPAPLAAALPPLYYAAPSPAPLSSAAASFPPFDQPPF